MVKNAVGLLSRNVALLLRPPFMVVFWPAKAAAFGGEQVPVYLGLFVVCCLCKPRLTIAEKIEKPFEHGIFCRRQRDPMILVGESALHVKPNATFAATCGRFCKQVVKGIGCSVWVA